jgi:hypothetical protein
MRDMPLRRDGRFEALRQFPPHREELCVSVT